MTDMPKLALAKDVAERHGDGEVVAAILNSARDEVLPLVKERDALRASNQALREALERQLNGLDAAGGTSTLGALMDHLKALAEEARAALAADARREGLDG